MVAVRAKFDGEKILLPESLQGCPPQEIIVIYAGDPQPAESLAWGKAQEQSFARVWENDEDSVHDGL
jgi:hypothetical protein